MMPSFVEILAHFRLDSSVVSCEAYGNGHINKTFLTVTETGRRYILQKINNHVFRNVPQLMENVAAITEHLRRQGGDPRGVLQLVKTHSGEDWIQHTDGSFWRVCVFVEGAICLETAQTQEDFYQSAVAFGTFQQRLKEFPADTLYESIPNFHNTVDRYRIFRETLEADPLGRAASVQPEIAFALARAQQAGTLVRLLQSGQLPLRVTHNDTKLNNVMLDEITRQALCVIDLDTVMPGSSVYDYGDSIRFGAASAPEDEQDLSKVELRLDLFRIYTRGFLRACPDLTALEREMLPMGAWTMTLENGVRFLTDHLDGDHYFAIHREGHNLDRARTQFALAADMEAKWDILCQIVKEETP